MQPLVQGGLSRRCVARRRFAWVRAIGPLTVTILSIAITSIFRLYNKPHNIRIVGSIPQVGASASGCMQGPRVTPWALM